jgi:hypothetical protein
MFERSRQTGSGVSQRAKENDHELNELNELNNPIFSQLKSKEL